MDVFRTDRIRNVVLLGHGGAGKTTLAEAMAYLAGMTNRLGRVEDGNTVSDYDKEEIKRHFSISTTLIPVPWVNVKINVLDTPVSPELLPPDENGNIAQKTEDNIGPYELHDFFLYNFVRFGFEKNKIKRLALKAFDGKYDERTISKWLTVFTKRFFISQFKRSCIPDSPKVGSVSLSPRGDRRMPSDASFNAFI